MRSIRSSPYGVALTNTPRIKDMGYISCSENGEAQLLAFSEGPIATKRPAEARRILLAEGDPNDPDGDGDDDGPVPPCVFQPAYAGDRSCPGYTRRPGDTDGDGACLLADRGCNGYRAIGEGVSPLPVFASIFSEQGERSMSKEAAATATGAKPPATAETASGDAEQKDQEAEQSAADQQENERILASERAEREKAQSQATELSERVRTLETAQKLGGVAERLDKAVREGRLTPAQRQTYGEHMVELSEERMEWLLSEIEKRPVIVDMKERGVAGSDAELDESTRLDKAAKTLMSESAKEGRSIRYRDALLQVSSTGYGRAG